MLVVRFFNCQTAARCEWDPILRIRGDSSGSSDSRGWDSSMFVLGSSTYITKRGGSWDKSPKQFEGLITFTCGRTKMTVLASWLCFWANRSTISTTVSATTVESAAIVGTRGDLRALRYTSCHTLTAPVFE
jgi:hypothetical protein